MPKDSVLTNTTAQTKPEATTPKTWDKPTGVEQSNNSYTYAATGKGVSSVPEQTVSPSTGSTRSPITSKPATDTSGTTKDGGGLDIETLLRRQGKTPGGTLTDEDTGDGPPPPGDYRRGNGTSAPAATSSAPAVNTSESTGPDWATAAGTVSRIVNGLDMSKQIGEANDAWNNAIQGYGQQSGQIIDQYQNSTNNNLNNYGQNTQGIINNYGQGANANLDTYGQNAQGVRNNYEQNVNQNLSGYANNTGNILDSSLNKMTQEVDSYQQTAQGLIDQLSNITGQELADYAASTGQTIAEATQQINDILKGLQDSLKPVNAGRVGRVDTTEQQNILQEMTNNQRQQAENQINYTVNKAVNELQRAQEDAQPQFQTQRNQIAAQERQALDNQALYAEMRGDRGGVGQAQYNAIQNNAATNLLKVNQQQTKLATDTQRQIADLRAQGEFDLADKVLQISQEALGQLMQLFKWADETNIGVEEFNIGVEQWEQERTDKLQQVLAEMGMDATKYTTDLGLNRQQYLTNQRLSAAQNEASLGLDTQQYATGRRLDIAQNDASQRLEREQYLNENQNNLASTLANMDLSREQYLNEGRMNVLQNTTNMNLSNEQYMQQQIQALNDALTQLGLSNAQYMTNADINRLTTDLNASLQNAQNMASTELTAANVFGAASDATPTFAASEANREQQAAVAQQMIASGITPTDEQLKALGWTKSQYGAYKSAVAAAQAAASRGGGGRRVNQFMQDITNMIIGGAPIKEINEQIENFNSAGVLSQSEYNQATQRVSNLKEGQNYFVSPTKG